MPDDQPEPPAPIRDADGRFLRGPGRRAGSRNRFSRALAMAVLEDFAEHRGKVLRQLRYSHLQSYAAMVSRLLPRSAEFEAEEDEAWPVLPALPPQVEGPAEPPSLCEINRAMDRLEAQLLAQDLAYEREDES
jgi:hypothetical protein